MGLFGSSSKSSSSTVTKADSDNLAADNNAQVTKINGGNGDIVMIDPGSVENIGRTIDLVGQVADGLFEASEKRAEQSNWLAQDAIAASRNDTAETLDKLITWGIPALAAVFILRGLKIV